jgi:hypothetical protein
MILGTPGNVPPLPSSGTMTASSSPLTSTSSSSSTLSPPTLSSLAMTPPESPHHHDMPSAASSSSSSLSSAVSPLPAAPAFVLNTGSTRFLCSRSSSANSATTSSGIIVAPGSSPPHESSYMERSSSGTSLTSMSGSPLMASAPTPILRPVLAARSSSGGNNSIPPSLALPLTSVPLQVQHSAPSNTSSTGTRPWRSGSTGSSSGAAGAPLMSTAAPPPRRGRPRSRGQFPPLGGTTTTTTTTTGNGSNGNGHIMVGSPNSSTASPMSSSPGSSPSPSSSPRRSRSPYSPGGGRLSSRARGTSPGRTTSGGGGGGFDPDESHVAGPLVLELSSLSQLKRRFASPQALVEHALSMATTEQARRDDEIRVLDVQISEVWGKLRPLTLRINRYKSLLDMGCPIAEMSAHLQAMQHQSPGASPNSRAAAAAKHHQQSQHSHCTAAATGGTGSGTSTPPGGRPSVAEAFKQKRIERQLKREHDKQRAASCDQSNNNNNADSTPVNNDGMDEAPIPQVSAAHVAQANHIAEVVRSRARDRARVLAPLSPVTSSIHTENDFVASPDLTPTTTRDDNYLGVTTLTDADFDGLHPNHNGYYGGGSTATISPAAATMILTNTVSPTMTSLPPAISPPSIATTPTPTPATAPAPRGFAAAIRSFFTGRRSSSSSTAAPTTTTSQPVSLATTPIPSPPSSAPSTLTSSTSPSAAVTTGSVATVSSNSYNVPAVSNTMSSNNQSPSSKSSSSSSRGNVSAATSNVPSSGSSTGSSTARSSLFGRSTSSPTPSPLLTSQPAPPLQSSLSLGSSSSSSTTSNGHHHHSPVFGPSSHSRAGSNGSAPISNTTASARVPLLMSRSSNVNTNNSHHHNHSNGNDALLVMGSSTSSRSNSPNISPLPTPPLDPVSLHTRSLSAGFAK